MTTAPRAAESAGQGCAGPENTHRGARRPRSPQAKEELRNPPKGVSEALLFTYYFGNGWLVQIFNFQSDNTASANSRTPCGSRFLFGKDMDRPAPSCVGYWRPVRRGRPGLFSGFSKSAASCSFNRSYTFPLGTVRVTGSSPYQEPRRLA